MPVCKVWEAAIRFAHVSTVLVHCPFSFTLSGGATENNDAAMPVCKVCGSNTKFNHYGAVVCGSCACKFLFSTAIWIKGRVV